MAKSKETFPKIATIAILKKIVMADNANLIFENLCFSPNQYADMERWRKNKDQLRITIEQIQGDLPMDEMIE